MNNSTTLTKHNTVAEVVRVYEEAKADIHKAFAVLAAAEKRLNDTFQMEHWSTLQIRGKYDGRGINFNRPEEAIEELTREVWRRLVDRLELRRFMTNTRWEQLQKDIKEGNMPEVTVANVMAFGQGMTEQIPQMAKEMIQEVFEFLRPRRNTYKTNSQFEIGPRVIIEYGVEDWDGFRWGVHYYKQQQFTTLENVFSMLDGKGSINKTHTSKLEEAIRASGERGRGETDYFEFKCFHNQNLHIKFKRLDLVKKLNQMAGGMRLREAREAA